MAMTFEQFYQGAPAAGSQTDLFTAGASDTDVVLEIALCNPDVADATIEMWAVPNGGSVNDTTKILHNHPVPANVDGTHESPPLKRKLVIKGSGKITSKATGAAVTVTISGIKVT